MDTQDPNKQRTQMRLQKLAARQGGDMSDEVTTGPVTGGGNPFAVETDKPLVALRGQRNGYLMIAPSLETYAFEQLPDNVLEVAKAWAVVLEQLGAKVYWLTISEVTPHLHIHIFPRWPEDTARGITLFEAREQPGQPVWSPLTDAAMEKWAADFSVEVI